MKVVVDDQRKVHSIWSGNSRGIKKDSEHTIVDVPADWAGNIGDSIDDFDEDWAPKQSYLERIHAKERSDNRSLDPSIRQRNAVAELKRLYDKEKVIWQRLVSENDPEAREKCDRHLKRIEREINAVYYTDFHLTLDEPIEDQVNLDVGAEAFRKDSEGYWEYSLVKYEDKVGDVVVKLSDLNEDERKTYEDSVRNDQEAKRFANMTQEEKEQEAIVHAQRELEQIDKETVRSLRAKLNGTDTQADRDKLAELEAKSKEQREIIREHKIE